MSDFSQLGFKAGVSLVTGFEGCSLEPYRDTAGLWTIGWGSRFLADGKAVTASTSPIAQEEADDLMLRQIAAVVRSVEPKITCDLTAYEQAALISFIYNIGAPAFRTSTMLRELNANDKSGAASEFDRWVKSRRGGLLVIDPGLVRRRRIERRVFSNLETIPKTSRAMSINIFSWLGANPL